MSPQQLDLHSSLGSSCSEQGSSGSAASSPAREAGSSKRGDECGVDCKLGAAPERQAIGDDLNASVVLASWVDM